MAINQFQQPIDYSMDVKSPFESALSGVQIGANLAQLQQQQKQQQAAQNQQVELQKLLSNPNASTQDLLKASALLPKDQSESVRLVVDKMTTAQQQQQLKQSGQVYAAMQSGNTEVAKNLLKQSAAAYRNSGKEDEAKAAETYIQLIDTNPAGAKTTVGLMMALLPGGDKALENIDKTLSTQRAEALQPSALRKGEAEATTAEVQATNEQAVINANLAEKNWNVKNLKSQISDRATQRNIDQQRLNLDSNKAIAEATAKAGEIPEFAQKTVNEAAINASASKQLAAQSMSLAQQLEAAGGGYGALSGASEWLSKTTGTQGALTELRKDYVRLKNQGVIKALPPGVATDKDIELAAAGFLPETANAKTLASFLRGMAKLQTIEANVSNAKVDWLAQNKGMLTKPKSTMVVGDYTAKTGESFSDFSNRIAIDTAKQFRSPQQIAEEQRQRSVAQIPTTSGAPAAAKPNVRAAADAILGGAR